MSQSYHMQRRHVDGCVRPLASTSTLPPSQCRTAIRDVPQSCGRSYWTWCQRSERTIHSGTACPVNLPLAPGATHISQMTVPLPERGSLSIIKRAACGPAIDHLQGRTPAGTSSGFGAPLVTATWQTALPRRPPLGPHTRSGRTSQRTSARCVGV